MAVSELWANLKGGVAEIVKTNGNGEITGQNLNGVLDGIINAVGGGFLHRGVASPSTTPNTPDGIDFYFASQIGFYSGFNLTIEVEGLYAFYYNHDTSTWQKELLLQSSGGGVSTPQITVLNTSGNDIPKGRAIYINGANSGVPTVDFAGFDVLNDMYLIGLAKETILNGAEGLIQLSGELQDVDTSGLSVGDAWLNTGGQLTSSVPSENSRNIFIGCVLTVGEQGSIYLKPTEKYASSSGGGGSLTSQIFENYASLPSDSEESPISAGTLVWSLAEQKIFEWVKPLYDAGYWAAYTDVYASQIATKTGLDTSTDSVLYQFAPATITTLNSVTSVFSQSLIASKIYNLNFFEFYLDFVTGGVTLSYEISIAVKDASSQQWKGILFVTGSVNTPSELVRVPFDNIVIENADMVRFSFVGANSDEQDLQGFVAELSNSQIASYIGFSGVGAVVKDSIYIEGRKAFVDVNSLSGWAFIDNKELKGKTNSELSNAIAPLLSLSLSLNFTCTVGATGANYTTFAAAYAAGHSNMLFISDATETASTAVARNVEIKGISKSIIWNLGDQKLYSASLASTLSPSEVLKISDLTLTHNAFASFSTSTPIFEFGNIFLQNVNITSATNCLWFLTSKQRADFGNYPQICRGLVSNVKFTAGADRNYLAYAGHTGDQVFFDNVICIGTTSSWGIIFSNTAKHSNISYIGTSFNNNQYCFTSTQGDNNSLYFEGGGYYAVRICSGLRAPLGVLDTLVPYGTCILSNISVKEVVNISASSDSNYAVFSNFRQTGTSSITISAKAEMSNCSFASGVIITSTDISISNSVFNQTLALTGNSANAALSVSDAGLMQFSNVLVKGAFTNSVPLLLESFSGFRFPNHVWNGQGMVVDTTFEDITISAGATSGTTTNTFIPKDVIGIKYIVVTGSAESSTLSVSFGSSNIFSGNPITTGSTDKVVPTLSSPTVNALQCSLSAAVTTAIKIRVAITRRLMV